MAILNKIRQRSIFLIVIIALALFSFVLADVIRNGGFVSQKSQNVIASINGNDIDRTEFARAVENASAGYRGGSSIQAVNNVWNKFVKQSVFDQQFEQLGIVAGKDQVNERLEETLANNPNFQNEAGVFDKAKMQEYVANLKATSEQAYQRWVDGEKELALQAQEEAYLTLIKAGVGATLKEGELAYKMENDKVDIKYVQLPFSSIPNEEVTVSEQEMKSYIDKHPEQYKAEASRSIQYILFKEEPSEDDKSQATNDIAGLLENSIEFNPSTKTSDTIAGFKTIENIEEYVNQHSSLPFEDRYVFKKDLPKTVADTLFNMAVGEVYGPYKDGDYVKISRMVAERQMPDSTKARHILVSWEGLRTAGDTKRTKEQAEQLADSILSVIKRDKSKFAVLASEFSADSSNKDKAGDLGFFVPGTMVPAFNDYCFDNKKGDMGVVETAFGYHIIEIEDQKNEQKVVKIGTIARKVEASEKTINAIFTETTKFQIAAKDKDFADAAKEINLSLRPVNKIKALDENIPGLGAQRSMVQWAFNEDSKIGAVKRFDVPDGYAVAQITAKASEGKMTVADAEVLVKPILMNEKKAEMLKAKIAGASLDAIASAASQTVKSAVALTMKSPTISGAGQEPEVVGTAFALEEGKISKPVVGSKGVYVVEVTKKTPATSLDSYLGYANQQTNTQTGAVNYKVFNALKEAADIEDKRAKFY